ncbi:putative glucomannan 4-beta-mannosyltransferase [Dioscorea sansibarensis]
MATSKAGDISAAFLSFFSSSCSLWGFQWEELVVRWRSFRVMVVVPLLKVALLLCLIMSAMLVFEKVTMALVSLYAKVFRRRPERRYKFEPLKEDEELGDTAFPMVLVQIPMYNEREVYKLSIGAACRLSYPADRVIIQVLDDSTDPEIKELMELECKIWQKSGKNIRYEVRDNRSGYKAGALKEGMNHDYVQLCEFVAIFDADFQPESDFLLRTVPFLVHNSELSLVQARWKFVNANECLMTRIQEMSMDYHFKIEQEAGSTMWSFFGFNGTAGVWRINALVESGGWKDRTTVEDMDLAVRASMEGWKFVYVGNVKVQSELPSTYKAYRNQQYRWSCGPANLFRKTAFEILKTKKISWWKKFYLLYSFFLVRRVIAHIVTFMFYCIVIPFAVLIPEVTVSAWGAVYIPTTITVLNAFGTPSSAHLLLFWIFYENVVALHRMRAVITGLLDIGRVNEWVVTDKLGDTLKNNSIKRIITKPNSKVHERIYIPELVVSVFLFICACYDFNYAKGNYYIYIFPQSITFLIMGLGYVGTFVPNK